MSDRDDGAAVATVGITPEEFGRRLKAAREAAGYTGNGAAKALGMAWGTYCKLEYGQQVPSFARLLFIVRELGLDPKILAPEWFERKRGR